MTTSKDGLQTGASFDISYWLDVGDVIIDIAPGWDDFAQENDAYDIDSRRVVGRNLLSFVQGDVTRMYVRTLIQSVRLLRKPMIRPYRCDSPDLRRFMEMRLTVEKSGLLRWDHRLIRSEPLARRLEFHALQAAEKSYPVVRCSICNRLKSRQGWMEPDLPEISEAPQNGAISVIYGVCPNCLTNLPKSK